MDKRYQVFVSSTFKDLVEERKLITQTLMEMDCIPAGMEHFPAVDQEQFEFIKKIIDNSDYYLIIIAGKYGSISPDTGLSYTEMEYDYAVKKGIKIIAIVHNDIDNLPKSRTEDSAGTIKKLNIFRKKVCSGRLVSFWKSIDQLSGLVSVNLNRTITTFPATGWVRADRVASDEILSELNDLRKENEKLKKEINVSNKYGIEKQSIDDMFFILKNNTVRLYRETNELSNIYGNYDKINLLDIFNAITPYVIDKLSETDLFNRISVINFYGADYSLTLENFNDIISDLLVLGLIEEPHINKTAEEKIKHLHLSKFGREFSSHIRRLTLKYNADINSQPKDNSSFAVI
ncbi:TPA: DUF4062 domain-containing protein [Serratia fonticola]